MTDNVNDQTNVIEQLVGEGKKFRDVESLARSVIEKDAFIPKLQEENKELRSILKTMESTNDRVNSMVEILEKVKGNLAGGVRDPGIVSGIDPKASGGNDNQPTSLTREEVKKLFDEMEESKRMERNKALANKRLFEVHGDKAPEVLKAKAEELGVTVDQMQDLARRSPNALLNMLGIPQDRDQGKTKQATSIGGHRSSVNTDSLGDHPANGNVRNKAYYEKVKQDMGITKFVMDRKLQIQMHKDMSALGEAFFE